MCVHACVYVCVCTRVCKCLIYCPALCRPIYLSRWSVQRCECVAGADLAGGGQHAAGQPAAVGGQERHLLGVDGNFTLTVC